MTTFSDALAREPALQELVDTAYNSRHRRHARKSQARDAHLSPDEMYVEVPANRIERISEFCLTVCDGRPARDWPPPVSPRVSTGRRSHTSIRQAVVRGSVALASFRWAARSGDRPDLGAISEMAACLEFLSDLRARFEEDEANAVPVPEGSPFRRGDRTWQNVRGPVRVGSREDAELSENEIAEIMTLREIHLGKGA